MKKVLILIPSLRGGGAEKVVVNLVNEFNSKNYAITLMTIFDSGVNKKLLGSNVSYKSFWRMYIRGAWRVFKYLPANISHKLIIKENYDIEIAYLEGIATKIISGGSDTIKKIAWIHCESKGKEDYFFEPYKNKRDFYDTYCKFNEIVGVSKEVIDSFHDYLPPQIKKRVINNTLNEEYIYKRAKEKIYEFDVDANKIKFISVGRLVQQKGFIRLIKIFSKICKVYGDVELYILGEGPQKKEIEKEINRNKLKNVHLLGYKENPYKYMSRMDCYICSSYQEGFSTSVTEAFIVGIPVITTACSGSEELCGLGAGLRCANNDAALEVAIRSFIEEESIRKHLRMNIDKTRKMFSKSKTLKEFEELLDEIIIQGS